MSENKDIEQHPGDGHEGGHHHINYLGIYLALVVLFLISVAGPEVGELTGLRWITLVTAFGIAIVKANLVIQNFMHLKWEKRLMKWMLATSLILMFLMVAGISPDVMNHEGNNWENIAAKAAVERGVEAEVEEAEPVEVVAVGFSAEGAYRSICATCHGAEGMGDGPAGAALVPPPANFTDPAFWADRDRDRIVAVLENGAASVGGSSLMAAYGGLYTDDQISELADYVMAFAPGE
ncbi:MAG: c-type cytochrome [Gemmatimonadota bacterium]|nr:c-type cytochrome [Gemmatimonadota bacterium]